MEVLYDCWCGLDVHAKTVVACLITKGRKEIRTFATMRRLVTESVASYFPKRS